MINARRLNRWIFYCFRDTVAGVSWALDLGVGSCVIFVAIAVHLMWEQVGSCETQFVGSSVRARTTKGGPRCRSSAISTMCPWHAQHSTSTTYYHDNAFRHVRLFFLSTGTRVQCRVVQLLYVCAEAFEGDDHAHQQRINTSTVGHLQYPPAERQ